MNVVNIPLFLLNNLKLVAWYVRCLRQAFTILTNHGLVRLLVIHALLQNPITWRKVVELLEEEVLAIMPVRPEDKFLEE